MPGCRGQDRADVLSAREDWFEGLLDLEPARLVFIDKTWTATNMRRSHGRCRRGMRLQMDHLHDHRKTTTLVTGLRMTGMVAPMVLDGPINGDWFEAYVQQVLVPDLGRGDVVIMDTCPATSAPTSARLSRPSAPASSSSRHTAPTSIRSRRPSPASRPCSARLASVPSPGSGPSSANWSICSNRRNAPTTSAPAAMTRTDQNPLWPHGSAFRSFHKTIQTR